MIFLLFGDSTVLGENERIQLKQHRCSIFRHRNRRIVYYCVQCKRNSAQDIVWICNQFKFYCYEVHKDLFHSLRE